MRAIALSYHAALGSAGAPFGRGARFRQLVLPSGAGHEPDRSLLVFGFAMACATRRTPITRWRCRRSSAASARYGRPPPIGISWGLGHTLHGRDRGDGDPRVRAGRAAASRALRRAGGGADAWSRSDCSTCARGSTGTFTLRRVAGSLAGHLDRSGSGWCTGSRDQRRWRCSRSARRTACPGHRLSRHLRRRTIAGMLLVTTALAIPLLASAKHFARLQRSLVQLTGVGQRRLRALSPLRHRHRTRPLRRAPAVDAGLIHGSTSTIGAVAGVVSAASVIPADQRVSRDDEHVAIRLGEHGVGVAEAHPAREDRNLGEAQVGVDGELASGDGDCERETCEELTTVHGAGS